MSWQPDYDKDVEGHGPPNHEDACPVCDKIDCDCTPEETEAEENYRLNKERYPELATRDWH